MEYLDPESCLTSELEGSNHIDIQKILSLWFIHPCLLQLLISIPFTSATALRCAILRILRAQHGCALEDDGVAGMDEVRRTDVVGIIDLGFEMAKVAGVTIPESLEQVTQLWPYDFAGILLGLSTYANSYMGIRVGLSWAFVELHDFLCSTKLLSEASRVVLSNICQRERQSLFECLKHLEKDKVIYHQVCQGYSWGRFELRACFNRYDNPDDKMYWSDFL